MSIRQQIHYTAVCDDCGEALLDDWASPAMFDTAADAHTEITQQLWLVEPSGELVCADCAGRGECLRYGHDWSAWAEQLTVFGHPVRVRGCRRCDITEVVNLDGTTPTAVEHLHHLTRLGREGAVS